ncbi:mitochondrial arginine transporter bac1 [Phtheirospermum japonicum]|uniref:Mitochondrial arginine transporter bac1 n=1 Tax=Phtheirospermum japonicum TaxID=374723 RepID=A0A830C8R9_9LAMI|nr:mitochondrial arginine transporter bac1 [Phtheirospermum japonicum]
MAESSGSGYKEYIAGMLAGVATVVVGHPFDTVKVKLQKHNTGANGMKYKSSLHCTASILKTDGVKGLYRGATPSFVGMAFESSLVFGMYSQTKQLLQGETKNGKPQPLAIIPSATFVGALISFILCPSELVKCRMQVQGSDSSSLKSSSTYTSPIDCALKTLKNEGLTGLFRGGGATLLRESVGNAVFFNTYEHVRYYMHLPLRDTSSDLDRFIDVGIGIVSGGVAGITCWTVVLPFDVAKTIIQTSSDKTQTRNPFRILESIYRRSGIKGCYTGLGPTIVRAFPANAAAIVTWELAMKLLGVKRE